jgi:hypothetical protein
MIVEVLLLTCAPLSLLGSFLPAGRDMAADRPALSGPWGALAEIGMRFPSGKLVARVLSTDDWDFIANHSVDTLRQAFSRERRAILRLCLRELRRRVDQMRNRSEIEPGSTYPAGDQSI